MFFLTKSIIKNWRQTFKIQSNFIQLVYNFIVLPYYMSHVDLYTCIYGWLHYDLIKLYVQEQCIYSLFYCLYMYYDIMFLATYILFSSIINIIYIIW